MPEFSIRVQVVSLSKLQIKSLPVLSRAEFHEVERLTVSRKTDTLLIVFYCISVPKSDLVAFAIRRISSVERWWLS